MKSPTQRDLQAENRRNQFIDVALTMFAERGLENVSIKDLAREVGVAHGLIYHYFPSKDVLLAAVFEHYNPLPEFEAIIEDMVDLPARKGLLFFAKRTAELLPEKRLVIRLLIREMLSPRASMLAEVVSLRQDVVARLGDYLQRRIDAGELRAHQPIVPIHMLVSSLLILLILNQPSEAYVEQFVDVILNGISTK